MQKGLARLVLGLGAIGIASMPACGSKKSGFDDPATTTPGFCAHDDCDNDGYPAGVDCNDTDPKIGPESYDFPGDGVDNDCDGTVDNPVESCETVPATPPGEAKDFARAAD